MDMILAHMLRKRFIPRFKSAGMILRKLPIIATFVRGGPSYMGPRSIRQQALVVLAAMRGARRTSKVTISRSLKKSKRSRILLLTDTDLPMKRVLTLRKQCIKGASIRMNCGNSTLM